MDAFIEFFSNLHTQEGIEQLVRYGGYWVLFLIIFSETGLLVGFFLPGDSLLVTAGVLCSTSMAGGEPLLNIYYLNLLLIVAAITGDQLGFYLGHKTGPQIFKREDGLFFKKKYIIEARKFYEKHGGKAILLARFVPILRTFVPFVAGIANMEYRKFISFNIVGGVLWITSMSCLGYFIGLSPLGKKLHLVILAVVFLSVLPLIIAVLRKLIQKFLQKKSSVA